MKAHAPTALATAGAVIAVAALLSAGPLDPPNGPVQPTYRTLHEVEPRTPIHQADIPLEITIPGAYYLTQDLHAVGVGVPVITLNDNATIDLNGFAIVGSSEVAQASSGIHLGVIRHATIRNGTIRDCAGPGIDAEPGTEASVIITDLHVLDNDGAGIKLSNSDGRIARCNVLRNGGLGINIANMIVRDCVVGENADEGIIGYRGLVQSNNAYDNGAQQITIFDGLVIENYEP